jgi:multidrug efflux pump subunit AcrB
VPDRIWRSTFRLPETAIRSSDHVFVVVDGKLERRDVRLIAWDGEDAIVDGSLEMATEVLVTRLTEASEGVRVREPADGRRPIGTATAFRSRHGCRAMSGCRRAGPGILCGADLVSTFVRHPNAANLLMVLMILFGAFSIARINTQFFPTIDRPTISIGVAWSGASAEDVETNVLALVEPEVRYISGVDEMTSTAAEGSATVRLEFTESTDMAQAMTDVETAVKAVNNLPEDSEDPTITRAVFFDSVAKLAVFGAADEVGQTRLGQTHARRSDRPRYRQDRFHRIARAEIRIEVPEIELRRLDTTISEVSSDRRQQPRSAVGYGRGSGRPPAAHARRCAGRKGAGAHVEVKSFTGGEKVLLGDIAEITDGFDRRCDPGLAGGSTAIELDVRRAPTADTLQTAAILSAYIDEITPQLPPGVEIATYEVAADALSARIWLLVKNGLGGLLVVVAILFLFLNARIAFWVAAGIPVAMLATIGFMYAAGQTINMISLFSLIMMLGIIVDDAIVVGEHTATRLEMGDDPQMAAENGVQMMLVPVIWLRCRPRWLPSPRS